MLTIYLLFPSFTERSALPPIWKFLTFTQNFNLDLKAQGAFSHAWSLCVEEQFYIVLPFIILGLARWGSFRQTAFIATSLLLSGIVLRFLLWQKFVSPFYHDGPSRGIGVPFFREIYYPTYCRLDGLVMGVVIAAIYRLRPAVWRRITQYGNVFLLVGILVLAIDAFIVVNEYSLPAATFGYPLLGVGFSILVISALSENGVFARVRWVGFRLGATLAFAFYLVHKPMIHLTVEWLTERGISSTSFWFPMIILLVCLGAATFLYLMVERPCLRLRDRLLRYRYHVRFSKDFESL